MTTTTAPETLKTYTRDAKNGALEFVVTPSGRHLRIVYRKVGGNFGTKAVLMDGTTEVAETAVVPLDFTTAARERALNLAAKL